MAPRIEAYESTFGCWLEMDSLIIEGGAQGIFSQKPKFEKA
jgi:hypothetical protein